LGLEVSKLYFDLGAMKLLLLHPLKVLFFGCLFAVVNFVLADKNGASDKFLAKSFEAQSFIATNSVTRPKIPSGSNIIVTLKESPEAILKKYLEPKKLSISSISTSKLVQILQDFASENEKILLQKLTPYIGDTKLIDYKIFWISNQIYIPRASGWLVDTLRGLPQVADVSLDEIVPLVVPFMDEKVSEMPLEMEPQPGITLAKAPLSWQKGYNGSGVVVGIIDTGVRASHTILRNNFGQTVIKGKTKITYGWFDAVNGKKTPYDDVSHGTHVAGIIAGSNGIGMAPGVKWMMCKACNRFGCTTSNILKCLQFMLCPTDSSGKNKDCSKAPKVINNSWGSRESKTKYDSALNLLRAAGIIPVFSAGNSGPNCNTLNSPGDRPMVLTVGASNFGNGLATFSSKGPTANGRRKPELVAPGVRIFSAGIDSDDAYRIKSGTSMAAPHATGAIALMLSRNRNLTFDQVKNALETTANRANLPATGFSCRNTFDGRYPNNMYGNGVLDANKAVSQVPLPAKK
jgi:subtilisin family serine protease